MWFSVKIQHYRYDANLAINSHKSVIYKHKIYKHLNHARFVYFQILLSYNKKSRSVGRTGSVIVFGMIYFWMISAIVLPISAGLATTVMPHSAIIFILAAAVSSAPPTMAPA